MQRYLPSRMHKATRNDQRSSFFGKRIQWIYKVELRESLPSIIGKFQWKTVMQYRKDQAGIGKARLK